jgi:hypothetical protein
MTLLMRRMRMKIFDDIAAAAADDDVAVVVVDY